MLMTSSPEDLGRPATQYFWDRVASGFPIKGWEIVEYDKPVPYCAERISNAGKWVRPLIRALALALHRCFTG